MTTEHKPHSELRERIVACQEQIEISPFSHTIAAGWYAEDVPRLIEQLETWQEIAEASRDWRKSDEFIGLLVRARVPKEWPASSPASEPEAS